MLSCVTSILCKNTWCLSTWVCDAHLVVWVLPGHTAALVWARGTEQPPELAHHVRERRVVGARGQPRDVRPQTRPRHSLRQRVEHSQGHTETPLASGLVLLCLFFRVVLILVTGEAWCLCCDESWSCDRGVGPVMLSAALTTCYWGSPSYGKSWIVSPLSVSVSPVSSLRDLAPTLTEETLPGAGESQVQIPGPGARTVPTCPALSSPARPAALRGPFDESQGWWQHHGITASQHHQHPCQVSYTLSPATRSWPRPRPGQATTACSCSLMPARDKMCSDKQMWQQMDDSQAVTRPCRLATSSRPLLAALINLVSILMLVTRIEPIYWLINAWPNIDKYI